MTNQAFVSKAMAALFPSLIQLTGGEVPALIVSARALVLALTCILQRAWRLGIAIVLTDVALGM